MYAQNVEQDTFRIKMEFALQGKNAKQDNIGIQVESATLEISLFVWSMSLQRVIVLNATKTIGSIQKENASRNLTLAKISNALIIHRRQYSISRMESANSEERPASRQTKTENVNSAFRIPSF